jgi:hypothetical protein
MKLNFILAAGGAAALLVGCASSHVGVVLDTVGPGPADTYHASATQGTLQVFSSYEVNPDFNSRDPYRQEFSDYRLLDANGQLIQQVHNNSGTILQRPLVVTLPAGRYLVEAQANTYGLVKVPVKIENGRDTQVHLEGAARWPNATGPDSANAVHLPNGQIVGWKSSVPMNQTSDQDSRVHAMP